MAALARSKRLRRSSGNDSASIAFWDLYVHAFDEDLRGAVASLDRALGS
jgi:hypothetical protein